MTDLSHTERFVLLIAAEKLKIEAVDAGDAEIVREPMLYRYRVAIPGHAVVTVTDEEIWSRRGAGAS